MIYKILLLVFSCDLISLYLAICSGGILDLTIYVRSEVLSCDFGA
jgi:hypothetical protein